MRKSDDYSQQFDEENQNIEVWQYKDDWQDDDEDSDWEEESSHARKTHQSHRGRGKGQARRSIEEFKEQQQLRMLLGDDLED